MKACSKCHETKPVEAFDANPRLRRGLHSQCKACRAAAFAAWRQANREHWAAYQNQWRERNPGKASSYHKAAGYGAQTGWRRANPDRVAEMVARRRGATPSWADVDLIRDIYAYAAVMREHGVDCEVDHIVPINGRRVRGFHSHHNLQVLLTTDNRKKGNHHE